MGWNPVKSVSDAVSSVGQGIENSVNQIVDSGGDFIRAVGRGDLGAAGEDLLSIGWEVTNILSYGAWNIVADAIKRALVPDIPPVDYQDRKVMSRDASEARKVVYGRTRVGATVRYIESSGADSNTLHLICIFATHTCADIEKVYFNDELAFIGTTAQGKYSGKAEMIFETGKQTTANAAIVAATPSGWTNSHKLLGHTYAYIKLTYDNDVYQGVPNVSAIVKGKDDIYDPRTTTSGWTDNHALVVRDYLAREYGVAYFDEQSFIDGANTCDELVASGIGTTEPRYTANGLYSVVGDPADTLDGLLAAGVAGIQYVQGLVRYVPGVYQAPGASASFSEGDFIGGLQIIPTSDAKDRINAIRGTYIDPAQDYEVVDFVPIVIDEYVTQDKQELYEDSKFPWTDSGTAARRLAKTFLERSRYGVRLSCTLKFRAFEFSVGDRIKISVAGLDKIFRIESMKLSLNGCDVSLQEDGPSVWAWEEGDALALDVPPALNLPNPYQVAQPTGFGATESLYIANDKKTIRSRISFAWDGSATALRWELQGSYQGGEFKSISDYLTVPIATLDDAQIGEWVFRVRAVNGIGVKSYWTSIPFTALGKTAPPADVTGFVAVVKPFGIELTWDAVPDLDLDRYEIRLGTVWDSATKLQAISALRWQWETRPTGSEQLLIKAIDTTDNYSTNAASASLVISNPLKPEPISATVIDNQILLSWIDSTTSFAIKKYIVRRGQTLSSSSIIMETTATTEIYFETQKGDFTYWIGAVDVAGNVGEFGSITATLDSPPDFVLQSDFFVNLNEYDSQSNCYTMIGSTITSDISTITADATGYTSDIGKNYIVIAPVDTTETVIEHFSQFGSYVSADSTIIKADSTLYTVDGGISPKMQIDAGYPIYLQPTPSTAYWEKTFDFVGTFGISRIKFQPNFTDHGAVSKVITTSYSVDGISFTDFVGTDVVGKNFRYVKIRIDFSSSDGASFTELRSAKLTLEVKNKRETGNAIASASDAGGTVIYFQTQFVDVNSIVVTPLATEPVFVGYDFEDIPNPVSFKVLLFDISGARITKPISYSIGGV